MAFAPRKLEVDPRFRNVNTTSGRPILRTKKPFGAMNMREALIGGLTEKVTSEKDEKAKKKAKLKKWGKRAAIGAGVAGAAAVGGHFAHGKYKKHQQKQRILGNIRASRNTRYAREAHKNIRKEFERSPRLRYMRFGNTPTIPRGCGEKEAKFVKNMAAKEKRAMREALIEALVQEMSSLVQATPIGAVANKVKQRQEIGAAKHQRKLNKILK